MFRKIVICATAMAGLLAVTGDMQSVEAARRVRIYAGPQRTVVRWRGGRVAAYRPYVHHHAGYYSADVQQGYVAQPYAAQPAYSNGQNITPVNACDVQQSGVIYGGYTN